MVKPSRPNYVARFIESLKAQEISVNELSYPRYQSQTTVSAYHFSPKSTAKGVILFVHGTGNDALFPYLQLFRQCLSRGYEVFSFDLDGHGRSSSTQLETSLLEHCIDDAFAKVRELRPNQKNIHIIGHSLGAALALSAVTAKRIDVASAILLSLPVELKIGLKEFTSELRGFFAFFPIPHFREYGIIGLLPAVGNFKRREYPIRLLQGDDHKVGAFSYVTKVRDILQDLQLKKRIKEAPPEKPVYFIYGEYDKIAKSDEGMVLQKCMQAAKLEILSGLNHFTTPFSFDVANKTLDWIEANSD